VSKKPSEFKLISLISKELPLPAERVELGIGDDAAVLKPARGHALLCSDAMVEGVHFDLNYATPEDIGHKALAACLSDLAAMNGRPVGIVVSLALPQDRAAKFLDGFYKGARAIAQSCGCDIVGGDLSSSPNEIFIDVACYGETDHPISRSGAKPGDLVAVSGTLGGSSAGFKSLSGGYDTSDSLKQKHLRPQPRFDLVGTPEFAVACTSLIDISDGLASELSHLAEKSRVGFEIQSANIPLHDEATLHDGLYGGEDYELLATFMPGASIPDGFTVLGRVTDSGLTMVHADGERETLQPQGFDHFSS